MRPLLLVTLALMLSSCAGVGDRRVRSDETPAVYALVLGTAQDAGLPQLGCFRACCSAARADEERRRLVTSVLIADRNSARRWLLDCSPDLEAQVVLARHHPTRRLRSDRPPLFDGILLTHAHMGHYAGLLELGREAYGSSGQLVHVSERMGDFLATNAPWSYLVSSGGLELRTFEMNEPLALSEDVSIEAIPVPHRDEFSDTVAFRVQGPERALLYLPDIDKWERFETPIEELIAGVDVALLDGTFFADGEIPGRSMADIPHPFIEESLARLGKLPAEQRAKVMFTHLNHTNPAANPHSDAARRVRAAGMALAREGQLIRL